MDRGPGPARGNSRRHGWALPLTATDVTSCQALGGVCGAGRNRHKSLRLLARIWAAKRALGARAPPYLSHRALRRRWRSCCKVVWGRRVAGRGRGMRLKRQRLPGLQPASVPGHFTEIYSCATCIHRFHEDVMVVNGREEPAGSTGAVAHAVGAQDADLIGVHAGQELPQCPVIRGAAGSGAARAASDRSQPLRRERP